MKWTKEEIKQRMLNSDAWMIRGMLAIYRHQTDMEQHNDSTIEANGVGFNGADADCLTRFSKWYLNHNFLTNKQMECIRKKMPKYANQLAKIANKQQ